MEAEKEEEKKEIKQNRKTNSGILYAISGGFFKEDFFMKNTRMIVLVAILVVFFISNRYSCMQKLREIDKYQRELKDLRFEALSISSELTKNSRQSQVELLIEEQGIDLGVAVDPPYELNK